MSGPLEQDSDGEKDVDVPFKTPSSGRKKLLPETFPVRIWKVVLKNEDYFEVG